MRIFLKFAKEGKDILILKYKTYLPLLAGSMIFSVAVYAMLMMHQLVNPYDGLWEYSYHTARGWELSLGRWFWLYIDQLRLGISTDPWTSLITLFLFSLGIVIFVDLFDMGRRKTGYLISFLFLSNAAVCISLSYRYMSPTFGVAFLLSMAAAWIIVKGKNFWVSVALGGGLVALSMGAYQSYLGCVCVALLGYLIYMTCEKNTRVREIFLLVLRCVLGNILGGVLYILILNIHLKIFHVALSEYNGANGYSIGNTLSKLPGSIERTFQAFQMYFFDDYFLSNVLYRYGVNWAVFAVLILGCGFVLYRIWKESKIKALLFILFAAGMPIACSAVLLVVTDAGLSMQMTGAYALFLPMIFCVGACVEEPGRGFRIIKGVGLVVMLLVLYGNIYQVQLDQNAMLEGKIATETLAGDVIDKLADEGCLDPELEYCVLGAPSENRSFMVSGLFGQANTYARFGSWWQDPSCSRKSWNGVFAYLCGVNMPISSVDTYRAMQDDTEVQNMPSYPEKGFIRRMGDVVVVKISG